MDDLDAALAATRKPVPDHAIALRSDVLAILAPAESFKAAVAAAATVDLDITTAEGRTNLVAQHALMKEIASLASARKKLIENLLARHFAMTHSRKLFVDAEEGSRSPVIAYEPGRTNYLVNDPAALRKALIDFAVDANMVTQEEVDEAVHAEVTHVLNHTKLNALGRRGEGVQAIIDAFRKVLPSDPYAGSVTIPKL